jgi:hypothetical protein
MIFIDRLSIIGDIYFFDTFQPQSTVTNISRVKEVVESLLKSAEILSKNEGEPKVIFFDEFEEKKKRIYNSNNKSNKTKRRQQKQKEV